VTTSAIPTATKIKEIVRHGPSSRCVLWAHRGTPPEERAAVGKIVATMRDQRRDSRKYTCTGVNCTDASDADLSVPTLRRSNQEVRSDQPEIVALIDLAQGWIVLRASDGRCYYTGYGTYSRPGAWYVLAATSIHGYKHG
jgi:hypothetical protein